MTDKVLTATHGSSDHPLRIGDVEIPCYVLENEARVVTQRGLQTAIGMSKSGGSGAHRMARFMARVAVNTDKKFEIERENPETQEKLAELSRRTFNLAESLQHPVVFYQKGVSVPAYGYEATILADLCDALLAAREAKVLSSRQLSFAKQAEILVRGFARVGIIALVDEATGYQEIRDKKALEQILARYISGELLEWAKMFPDEFYKELFRLRGWQWHNMSVKRPQYVGKLTVDLVYRRLAPGVYAKLKEVNPKNQKGKLTHHHHRWLTDADGKPALDRHLHTVTAFMRASSGWDGFMRLMNRSLPRYSENLPLPGLEWTDFNDDKDDEAATNPKPVE